MHKDLEEINKIVAILPHQPCEKEAAAFVLKRICCSTEELTRNEKKSYYLENKEHVIESFQKTIGSIAVLCKNGKCEKCPVSKWCNFFRKHEQKKEYKRKALTYADFFCGAGGLSLGFYKAGFKMSLANDIQECCTDTIALNHPEVPEKHVMRKRSMVK